MNTLTKYITCFLLASCVMTMSAQVDRDDDEDREREPNTADFRLGQGLQFSLNEGDYKFHIGGFIQPAVGYEKLGEASADYQFNAKRAFFIIDGTAVKEKVSFLLQTDFSFNEPLLDAWVAYHPTKSITITAGQKQTFLNNREMIYREDKLQFTERSRLSQLYSNTGREFGLFVQGRFGESFGIAPGIAMTSGDGRNSFGSDSRDADKGGLKYGARLDVYPLGYFKDGNDQYTADLGREESLKVLIGGAVSQNNGASNASGEGHGDFLFYDINGNEELPDYSQAYVDLLMKYKGFSFLGEYVNSSASNLGTPFLDTNANDILAPTEVSEYLVLGDSYSLQAGYVTKSGFSLDLRYENTNPEFENNLSSLLRDSNSYTIGLTKYFLDHNLKLQASFSKIEFAQGDDLNVGELVFQIVF
ncbi:hypothetical protein [Nonlabens agnitus]|uniref:Porin n=1 Tax=Nonlabens agnitus TaxID=870484 RepID=A0A2S9WRW8_9FLAO|nr:hypothetical protein [Nonlabens agnitus]PRP66244.1 hypothetical protein BST86_03625 [Nonlabens agnitus]